MRLLFSALACALLSSPVLSAQTAAPRSGDDQAAFNEARAVTDPAQRVAALKGFVQEHPGTALAQRAAMLELETELRSFPDHTAEIHALAAADVAATAPGFERWAEKARLADMLASAGPSGADLADAKTWAEDAVAALTEESYRRQMAALQAKYRLDPLPAKQIHHGFVRNRASFLAALANVELRDGELDTADRALTAAFALDPLASKVSSLRGQLALLRHQDREALADFERAEAEGDLPEPWRGKMLSLYQQLDQGTAAGLNEQVDEVYDKLFPPPFSLPPRKLPPGGHTVLLELFTGSGCEPCVAPDLALESLLATYTRQDLVVLAYDEHIPRPDPLANPDSVARAANYGVGSTPEAFLDGDPLPVPGASRADVENVVVGFADAIEDRAAESSGVGLQLNVTQASGGTLQAEAILSPVGPVRIASAASAASRPLPSHALVRFALVEDTVRYSGENGIRFHRMVVRSLARADAALPAQTPSGAPPAFARVTFRPAEIAEDQAKYLAAYETGNDRFGAFHFRTLDLPIDPDHLAVAVWIEDSQSHAVLQAAFAPVPAS